MSLPSNIPRLKILLDANVLFAGAFFRPGGARMLLRLGEGASIDLLVPSSVLTEAENALRRKAPEALGHLALLLDRARCTVVANAPWPAVKAWNEVFPDLPDAGFVATASLLAAAIAADAHYLVTLDRRHILGNERLVANPPLPVGTPGNCLDWLRTVLGVSYVEPSPFPYPGGSHRLNERPDTPYSTEESR